MLTWSDVMERAATGNPPPARKVSKSDEDWRSQLPGDAHQVTRLAATERPFSSELCSRFEPGRYACVCCGAPLFDSDNKFDSGTGWPSFTQPVVPDAVAYHADRSHGMLRIEATCNRCDAHLGHVFEDGPPPSGLRYCMNALALEKTDHPQ